MTILAVDDEPLIRTLVATVLRENGFDVLTAECADEALAVFYGHPEDVDLLLSDVVMPGMDGAALAQKLRAARPDLQVILMSGYCDCEQLAQGFEFIPKPFRIPDLLAKIHALLRNRGRRAGLHSTKRASSPTQPSPSKNHGKTLSIRSTVPAHA